MNLEGRGIGVCVKIWIVGDIEINAFYLTTHKYAITIGYDALADAWKYLDA